MSKERMVAVLCIVGLAGVAGVSFARNLGLRQAKEELEKEVEKLNERVTVLSTESVREEESEEERVSEPVKKRPFETVAADFREALLAAEEDINLLEARLRDRNMVIDDLEAKLKEREERMAGFRSRRGRGQERMEALKNEDPERYEQVMKERAEFRERMAESAIDRHDFLSSVDVSTWPTELQENHAKVLETVAKMSELLAQPPDAEGAGESRRDMFRQFREMREMFDTERTMLLYDAAQQIGFDEEGSWQFVDYVERINEVTSGRSLFRGGPGGRGPRRQDEGGSDNGVSE